MILIFNKASVLESKFKVVIYQQAYPHAEVRPENYGWALLWLTEKEDLHFRFPLPPRKLNWAAPSFCRKQEKFSYRTLSKLITRVQLSFFSASAELKPNQSYRVVYNSDRTCSSACSTFLKFLLPSG